MVRTRRAMLRGAWSAAAGAVLGACAAPTVALPLVPRAAPGTVHGLQTLRVVNNGLSYSQLVSAFYDKYPNVRVEWVDIQYDPAKVFGQQLVDEVKGGQVDILQPFSGMKPMLDGHLLLDLDPLVRASGMDLKPYGDLLDQMRWHGRLYDFPYTVGATVLLFNLDMFQAAGGTAPVVAWTWQDFRQDAARLSQGAGGAKIWGYWSNGPYSVVSAWLSERNPSGGNPSAALLSECLQFFYGIVFEDKSMSPAPPPNQPFFNQQNAFARSQAAMTDAFTVAGNLRNNLQGAKFHWDAVPMPQQAKGGKPALPVSVGSLAITAGCRAVDAAWAFILFAISPLGQAALSQGQFAQAQMPVYRTDAQVQAWLASAPANGGPGLKALLQMPWKLQPRVVDLPSTPAAAQAENQAINAALSGQTPVDQAIHDYQAALAEAGSSA